jgi:hypothetical protein
MLYRAEISVLNVIESAVKIWQDINLYRAEILRL